MRRERIVRTSRLAILPQTSVLDTSRNFCERCSPPMIPLAFFVNATCSTSPRNKGQVNKTRRQRCDDKMTSTTKSAEWEGDKNTYALQSSRYNVDYAPPRYGQIRTKRGCAVSRSVAAALATARENGCGMTRRSCRGSTEPYGFCRSTIVRWMPLPKVGGFML